MSRSSDRRSVGPPRRRPRWWTLWLLVSLLGGAAVAWALLTWHDVLPGGWTLRGLVRPHAAREAEERAAHRAARLAEFAREEPHATEDTLVFLGSSTIERFPLEAHFPGARTLDRGIGDEGLAELVERARAGLPRGARAYVVYSGSVDVRRLARAPEDVARDAEALLDVIAAASPPATPVVWLGVLPDRTGDADVLARVQRLNELLAALLARRGGTFVPTHRAPLLTADGRLDPAHSVDDLHLSERGYTLVAGWLRAALPALGGGD